MGLHYPAQCLICRAEITTIPQASTSSSPKPENAEPFSPFHLTRVVQSFTQFCDFLKIDFPGNSLKFKNVGRSLKVDEKSALASVLCTSCIDMGNYLASLYGDLRGIKKKIDFGIYAVQGLMKEGEKVNNHKAGDDHDGGDPPAKKMKQNGTYSVASSASSSVGADFIEFGKTFRNLVKDVETGYPVTLELSEGAAELAQGYQELDDKFDDDYDDLNDTDEEGTAESSAEPIVITLDDDDEPVEIPYQNGDKSPVSSATGDTAGIAYIAYNGHGKQAEAENVSPNLLANGNAFRSQ